MYSVFFRLVFVLMFTFPVFAKLKVEVNRGFFSPIPIAITDFTGISEAEKKMGKGLRQVIANNLGRSGYFNPLAQSAYIQDCEALKKAVRYEDWRIIKVDALVYGDIQISGNSVTVNFRLVDVYAQKQIEGLTLKGKVGEWRKLAHLVSNAVYKRLTGENGYFTSRIAYVAESGIATRRIKRLAIMDQDGENHRFLTRGHTLVMTPRFSPDGKKVAYFEIRNRHGDVYIYDLEHHTTELIGTFEGMSYAPKFSPDGQYLIYSLATGFVSHIYEFNLRTRKKKKLTFVPSLNTSPCYSPDGKQITFVSDRSGTAQIYIMDRDGSNERRISFGAGRYYTPDWSPNGKYIAFTKTVPQGFFVGVMNPDGTEERALAQDYFVEGPTWSNNSQMIMFTRRTPINSKTKTSISRIYMINVAGYNEREILTPMDAAEPEWSAGN